MVEFNFLNRLPSDIAFVIDTALRFYIFKPLKPQQRLFNNDANKKYKRHRK